MALKRKNQSMMESFLEAMFVSVLVVLTAAVPQQIELQYNVTEESVAPGALVGDLVTDGDLRGVFSGEGLEQIRFQFLSQRPKGFTLDDEGAIRTTERIDRDTRCESMAVCEVKFDIITQPVKYTLIFKITLFIADVNDNTPDFGQREFVTSLSESSSVGASFVLPTAVDPDSPAFGVQRYELVPSQNAFQLKEVSQGGRLTEIRVELKAPLDRELQNEYRFSVVAYDGEGQGELQVTVNVLDSNDNRPVFTESAYEVQIAENIPLQTTILQITATDADNGLNAKVIYGFTAQTQANLGQLFAISAATGEIYVTGTIDYELSAVFYLGVQARDGGPNPVPADTTVTVRVTDENDHPPEITVNTVKGSGVEVAEIPEDSPPGTFVARIVVSDKDSGLYGQVNCSMNDNHFDLQALGSEYQIVTSAEVDREKQAEYNLAFICKDNAIQPQISIKHIEVQIRDINDNGPAFAQRAYFSEITENSYAQATITQISAVDPDAGDNAKITYSLDGEVNTVFAVDPVSGVLRARLPLDREDREQYRFQIYASDHGSPARTATASMVVAVKDVNDQAPRFSQNVYSFGVLESEDSGTEAGIVSVEDLDAPPFNRFTFSLQQSSLVVPAFRVNSDTGRITTTRSLDRETKSSYQLIVFATDISDPKLSGTATVSVFVMDKNDNSPKFVFPTEYNDTVYVPSDVAAGFIVGKAKASDADLGKNALLTYSISAGDTEIFAINPKNGIIAAMSGFEENKNQTFRLEITVRDGGSPSKSSTSSLNIVVNKAASVGVPGEDLDSMLTNLTIVVSVSCLSGVLIVALVLAIAVVCHKQRYNRHRRQWKHKCRMDALKVLTAKDAVANSSEESIFDRDGSPDSSADASDLGNMEKNLGGGGGGGAHMMPSAPAGGQPLYTVVQKPTKVDLSVEKSMQWLATLESPNKQDPTGLSPVWQKEPRSNRLQQDPSLPSSQAPEVARTHVSPSISRHLLTCQSLGVTPDGLTAWTAALQKQPEKKSALQGILKKEQGDNESVNSGFGSNTDSGHGPSEEGDNYRPASAGNGSTPNGQNSTRDSLSTPIMNHLASPRRHSYKSCPLPAHNDGATSGSSSRTPPLPKRSSCACSSHTKECKRHCSKRLAGKATDCDVNHNSEKDNCPAIPPRGIKPLSLNSHSNNLNMNSDTYCHPSPISYIDNELSAISFADRSKIAPSFPNYSSIAPTDNYSIDDIDDILLRASRAGARLQPVEEDAESSMTSQTSGSYVVDPSQLVREIDELIFSSHSMA